MTVFDHKSDLTKLKEKVTSLRLVKDAHGTLGFKTTFQPMMRYNGVETDASSWFVDYANGIHGSAKECDYLWKNYLKHISQRDCVVWDKCRDIGKTLTRIRSNKSIWGGDLTHVEFYLIVSTILKAKEGAYAEYFDTDVSAKFDFNW